MLAAHKEKCEASELVTLRYTQHNRNESNRLCEGTVKESRND